ncbi:MAG TPA: HRDC domain-containing protein [Mycobacteriales bacterium]|nr:HRDC domain-containing protein [Mycobacteriales bacterium]
MCALPLLEPRDGVPPVVASPDALARTVAAFAAGTGPVAVDAERASGYRYGQQAYLVQIRRAGAGTALIDPVGCPDLSTLGSIISNEEWILHAANQDLPCLAGVGLVPRLIFDTELAGRLAGYERVGLGAIVEELLGFTLEKGHSASDWSQRPLPAAWLVYAALDVEVLVELRDALAAELERQGKLGWAREEFAAIVAAPPAPSRVDPWRRTSGIHRLRTRRQLAALRGVWELRENMARDRDLAPGRLLSDTALIAAVLQAPASVDALTALPVWGGRATRRLAGQFFAALRSAGELPEPSLPTVNLAVDGPPPTSRWAEKDPAAAARLTRARAAVAALAAEHRMPAENLLAPDLVRRLAWEPPGLHTEDAVGAVLRAGRARDWQVRLTAAALAAVLDPPPEMDDPLG